MSAQKEGVLAKLPARLRAAEPGEVRALAHLALGRIFGMLLRPYQPGDEATYHECRAIVLDASDELALRGEMCSPRRYEPHAMTSLYKPPERA